eukprot:5685253-Pleurochrysis_carterae.AAC.1
MRELTPFTPDLSVPLRRVAQIVHACVVHSSRRYAAEGSRHTSLAREHVPARLDALFTSAARNMSWYAKGCTVSRTSESALHYPALSSHLSARNKPTMPQAPPSRMAVIGKRALIMGSTISLIALASVTVHPSTLLPE